MTQSRTMRETTGTKGRRKRKASTPADRVAADNTTAEQGRPSERELTSSARLSRTAARVPSEHTQRRRRAFKHITALLGAVKLCLARQPPSLVRSACTRAVSSSSGVAGVPLPSVVRVLGLLTPCEGAQSAGSAEPARSQPSASDTHEGGRPESSASNTHAHTLAGGTIGLATPGPLPSRTSAWRTRDDPAQRRPTTSSPAHRRPWRHPSRHRRRGPPPSSHRSPSTMSVTTCRRRPPTSPAMPFLSRPTRTTSRRMRCRPLCPTWRRATCT